MSRQGNECTLTWTAPADAERYLVVYGDKPITDSSTSDPWFLNWWAAEVIGPQFKATPGTKEYLTFTVQDTGYNMVYAGVFCFDAAFNMSSLNGNITSVERNSGDITVDEGVSVNPNPFNPQVNVTVRGVVDAKQRQVLEVFDVRGHKVASLEPKGKTVTGRYGRFDYSWNATASASGVYIIKIKMGQKMWQRKVTLIK